METKDTNQFYQPPSSQCADTNSVKYFKAWIIFFLIAGVGGMIFGAIMGAVLGAILGALKISPLIIMITTGGVGFLLSLPLSFFTFKWSVKSFIVKQLI